MQASPECTLKYIILVKRFSTCHVTLKLPSPQTATTIFRSDTLLRPKALLRPCGRWLLFPNLSQLKYKTTATSTSAENRPPLTSFLVPPPTPEYVPLSGISEPWKDLIQQSRPFYNVRQRLHAELLAFMKWAELTDDEIHIRTKLGAHIRSTLLREEELLPSSTVYSRVGSTYATLELPDSDIDLNISTSNTDPKDRVKHRKFLAQLGKVLNSQGISTSSSVQSTPLGLVLRITALPTYGNLCVDVTVNDQREINASRLLRSYATSMPALRPLVMFLKVFLRQESTGGSISNHTVTCMCIGFLKMVSQDFEKYKTKPDKTLRYKTLGALLLEFFKFYGHEFQYESQYMNTAKGEVSLKAADGSHWTQQGEVVIQDICQTPFNVARQVGYSHWKRIQETFMSAHARLQLLEPNDPHVLSQIIDFEQIEMLVQHRKSLFNLRHSGRYKTVKPHWKREEIREKERQRASYRSDRAQLEAAWEEDLDIEQE